MTVGLVISLFTSLFMTRLMFDIWQHKGWLTKLTMMRLFHRPDWDFMSIRYIMFAVTLGLAVLGAALFIGRIPSDLNIDFVGGTAYGGKLTKAKTIGELRPLFEERHQKEVLSGVDVKELDDSMRRYELTFRKGDNKPRTVSLSNQPKDGKGTKKDREDDVAKRASLLPEPSVELLFNTTNVQEIINEMKEGKSRNFVMRTTEKEPELVQACVDQLLRDDSGPLLRKVFARPEKVNDKGETRFHFYKTQEEANATPPAEKTAEAKDTGDLDATASPSILKSLLNREARREFKLHDEKKPLPFVIDVVTEGASDKDGKYRVMKVVFEGMQKKDKSKVEKAVESVAAAFATRPLPDRLENFDSALATETRFRAMWAVLASWAAILLYLWFRFGNWTFGLAAVICLIHDLFFTLGAIAICHFFHGGPLGFIGDALMLEDFKVDLPAVAALLTLVGYSVNDTIVVFDRIREVRGKNPDLTPKMLNDSINQTLSRTILSSLTVFLVVVVLYIFGGPGVHLFAFIMVVGVVVGTYSSIYIAAPLLLMFGEGKHEETAMVGAKPAMPTPQGATV
ncbi:MAG: protein translocase subunit SecF [Planctomycetes bacterium]|nr:protein translocase subunit SecF [Planctomycetota bacterium]